MYSDEEYTDGQMPFYTTGNQFLGEYEQDYDDIAISSPSPPQRTAPYIAYPQGYQSDEIQQWDADEDDVDAVMSYATQQPVYLQQRYAPGTSFRPQPALPAASFSRQPAMNSSRQLPRQNFHQYNQAWQSHPPPQMPEFEEENSGATNGGVRLRPVSDLPDVYRGLFKFGVFNAIQSICYDTIINSDMNLVTSAPTGSGKTVLFELALIRMFNESQNSGRQMKAVYMAPTKSLCSERFKDWQTKFEPLGIKCCELTGDTVTYGKGAWGDAKHSSIIVTTSEKWDSLSRNWDESQSMFGLIKLFLVDEVHILNESRGSVLEVVITRMRRRGANVRFVLVSATVPNIHDIAAWIKMDSRSDAPAKVFQFGEEFRPCKLTRHVIGVPRSKGANDFQFNRNLDYKLFGALQRYSVGKPILVFVSTRKGTTQTAEQLKKDYLEAEKGKNDVPWTRPRSIDHIFHDRQLGELASLGIGVHHAGLMMEDRRAVEELYLKRTLRIVVATSTLAVGVNLPAHMVVIKGVTMYQGPSTGSAEYTDLDIMQMLGRAGRPQFDKDGIAVILCEIELEEKYKALAQGRTILESNLHFSLVEHLNSEIGLGTVTSVGSAKTWLKDSFLFHRIKKNPDHYSMGKQEGESWEERVDGLVMESVAKLKEAQLVETPEEESSESLRLTDYGDIMSRFYIQQSTMSKILDLPATAGLREMLELVSTCDEVASTKLRASEKTALNTLKKNNDIRFEVKRVDKTSDKMLLIIQAFLACINLSSPEFRAGDSQLTFDAVNAFRHLPRIARALVEVATTKQYGHMLKNGLILLRCVNSRSWDDRPAVLRQIDHLGEKSIKILSEHGITTFDQLRKQDTLRIENLLSRRPPFGLEVMASLKELPHYYVKITELDVRATDGSGPVEVDLKVSCGLVEEAQAPSKVSKKRKKNSNWMSTTVLTLTSDMDFVDFRKITTKVLEDEKSFELEGIQLTKPSQYITVHVSSDSIAGVEVVATYKPKLASSKYPTMNTRPQSSIDMNLEDLPEDFWNMDDIDKFGDEVVTVRDLTVEKAEKAAKNSGQTEKAKKPANKAALSPPSGPHKLPNGNYECNHPCKDKSSCRHMCCRDGLAAPPASSKRQNANSQTQKPDKGWKAVSSKSNGSAQAKVKAEPPESPNGSFAHLVGQNPKLQPKAKKMQQPVKEDTTIADLEDLHRKMDVSGSIKVPEGRRIKVAKGLAPAESTSKADVYRNGSNADNESIGRRRRPKGPRPDFNIELADLADGSRPASAQANPQLLDMDDDDLPAPSQLFAQTTGNKKQTKKIIASESPGFDSETRYTNSDDDAFMADVTLPGFSPHASPFPAFPAAATAYAESTPVRRSKRPLTPSPVMNTPTMPPKKAKLSKMPSVKSKNKPGISTSYGDSAPLILQPKPSITRAPTTKTRREERSTPLFLRSSPPRYDSDDDDMYVKDPKEDQLVSPPPLEHSTSRLNGGNKFVSETPSLIMASDAEETGSSELALAPANVTIQREMEKEGKEVQEEEDEFADFDAWLHSGAVKIVD